VIRDFGDLRYARALVDLPDVDDLGLAIYLYFVAHSNLERPAELWPIPFITVRALALELAVGFAQRKEALPRPLVALLAMSMKLPLDFLEDPVPLYSGDRSDPEHRRWRSTAEALDAESIATTGVLLPVQTLERAIKASHEGKGPTRSTLREWRQDEDYQLWLDVIRKQYGVATTEF